MGYVVEGDGVVRFTCRGCGKETTTRSFRVLPQGWCISGILGMNADPESEAVVGDTDPEALQEAATTLADHFCKAHCGKKYLRKPEIVKKVKKLGVMLVLWGECILVVDGTPLPKEDAEINSALFGDGEGDADKDKDDGGTGDDKPDKPPKTKPGSPPPLTWDDGRSPI